MGHRDGVAEESRAALPDSYAFSSDSETGCFPIRQRLRPGQFYSSPAQLGTAPAPPLCSGRPRTVTWAATRDAAAQLGAKQGQSPRLKPSPPSHQAGGDATSPRSRSLTVRLAMARFASEPPRSLPATAMPALQEQPQHFGHASAAGTHGSPPPLHAGSPAAAVSAESAHAKPQPESTRTAQPNPRPRMAEPVQAPYQESSVTQHHTGRNPSPFQPPLRLAMVRFASVPTRPQTPRRTLATAAQFSIQGSSSSK